MQGCFLCIQIIWSQFNCLITGKACYIDNKLMCACASMLACRYVYWGWLLLSSLGCDQVGISEEHPQVCHFALCLVPGSPVHPDPSQAILSLSCPLPWIPVWTSQLWNTPGLCFQATIPLLHSKGDYSFGTPRHVRILVYVKNTSSCVGAQPCSSKYLPHQSGITGWHI